MDVLDISFSHIKINSPIQHENDVYEFPLDYDDKPFLFSSKQKYGLHQGDSIYQLHIQDKNELIFFSNLYDHLVETMYEMHGTWFANQYERTQFEKMFKNYLYPNIKENAINIQCVVDASMSTHFTLRDKLEVCPTFKVHSILFDQVCFQVKVSLENIEVIPESQEVESEEPQESEVEAPEVEASEEEAPEVEASEEEPSKPDETQIEEVYIQPDEHLESSNIELNDEDYYILFKVIQRKIKDNFSNALLNIFEQKQISTKNFDVQQIVYDSDENEESEDEYLENDEFEDSYKNMV